MANPCKPWKELYVLHGQYCRCIMYTRPYLTLLSILVSCSITVIACDVLSVVTRQRLSMTLYCRSFSCTASPRKRSLAMSSSALEVDVARDLAQGDAVYLKVLQYSVIYIFRLCWCGRAPTVLAWQSTDSSPHASYLAGSELAACWQCLFLESVQHD